MRRIASIGLLLVVSLTAGCGGGGGGGGASGSASPTPTPVASGSRLFFTGSLHYIDTTSPSAPVQVEANAVTETVPVFDSFWSLKEKYQMYVSGGKLWRVSAVYGGSSVPQQVSSETALGSICPDSSEIGSDYSNLDNSQFVYALPGVDGLCDTTDDKWHWVSITAAATVAAQPALKPLARYRDSNNLEHWLAVDSGSNVVVADVNFSNPAQLVPNVTATTAAYNLTSAYPATLGIYLQIDKTLRKFNVADNTMTLLHTAGSVMDLGFTIDNNNLYFIDGPTIYRIAHAGGPATALVTEANATIDPEMYPTTNRVAYQVKDTATSNWSVRTIGKTATLGTPPTTLVGSTTVSAVSPFSIKGAGATTVFIQEEKTAPVSTTAYAISEDKVKLTRSWGNTSWLGTTIAVTSESPDGVQMKHFIYATGMTGQSAAGSKVSVITAADPLNSIDLGTLDSDVTLPIFSYGLTSDGLLLNISTSPTTSSPMFDVYYANPDKANSLVRVTKTPTVSEGPAL